MDSSRTDKGEGLAPSESLIAAHEAYGNSDWALAHERFTAADGLETLGAHDLWTFSVVCAMLGRDDEYFKVLERAFDGYLVSGENGRAIRCAFWLGLRSLLLGEVSRGTGWLARAQRLLARQGSDSVERGYLLLPGAERQYVQGEYEEAFATAAEAIELAERFGDQELLALALHIQGRVRIKQARVADGLELLDEAMLTASSGEMFPPVAGVVYCGVIASCRSVYELKRAQEWTAVLSDWCDRQRGMVAFAGRCLVHRSEIFQLHGDWGTSLSEARKACGLYRTATDGKHEGTGPAYYQQGELHRLMGDFEAAEEAFRLALECGLEPQPGMALLRLAEGKPEAARASLGRTLAATTDRLKRARVLPALIECLLEGDRESEAKQFCRELGEIAEAFESPVLKTLALMSKGELELATGEPQAAAVSLKLAWRGWQEHAAPYEVARVRWALGRAARALGDEDTARLEFEAAARAFAELGAKPDRIRVEALLERRGGNEPFGLSKRELQVLRLIADGASNKAIADRLALSERTVHRHVSNIFVKLEVSSRAAATAAAYRHGLVA